MKGLCNRPFSVDDRSSPGWKFGEEELCFVLYLMDVCNDLVSAAKFLLWLLPKVLSNPNSTIMHVKWGRHICCLLSECVDLFIGPVNKNSTYFDHFYLFVWLLISSSAFLIIWLLNQFLQIPYCFGKPVP